MAFSKLVNEQTFSKHNNTAKINVSRACTVQNAQKHSVVSIWVATLKNNRFDTN